MQQNTRRYLWIVEGVVIVFVLMGCFSFSISSFPFSIIFPATHTPLPVGNHPSARAAPSTAAASPSPTLTPTLTPTATFTPTPTLALPVSVGTPYPTPPKAETPASPVTLRLLAQYGDGVVYDMAYLSQRNAVALATSRGVALYDAKTLAPVGFWPTQYLVQRIAYSHGLVAIASGSRIEVRRENDGEIVHVFNMTHTTGRGEYENGKHGTYTPVTFTDREKWITALAASPDGRWLAAGAKGLIDVWDLSQGTLYQAESRLLSLQQIWHLRFSADSQWLFYVRSDADFRQIRMEPWGEPGKSLFAFAKSHTYASAWKTYDFISTISLSPDNQYYAVGSYLGKVFVWKEDFKKTFSGIGGTYTTRIPWRVWDLSHKEVLGINFYNNTASIVSRERSIEWRDIAHQKEDKSLDRQVALPFTPWKAQPLPDGRWAIVSTGGELYLLDAKGQITAHKSTSYSLRVWAAAVFPKGEYVALAGWPSDVVIRRVKDGQVAAVVHFTRAEPPFTAIAISPDERYLVISDLKGKIWRYDLSHTPLESAKNLYLAPTLTPTPTPTSAFTPTPSLTPTPTPTRVLSEEGATPTPSSPSATPTPTEKPFQAEAIYHLPQRYDLAPTLAFAPQGTLLAVGTYWFATYIWDVSNDALYRSFEWLDGTVTHLAFSPDGAYLAGASVNQIIVWQISGGLVDHVWTKNSKPTMGWVNALAWRPGPDLELVSGSNDQRWRLWKFRETKPVMVSAPLGFKIEQVATSHNGNFVAVSGQQHLIVWSLVDGRWVASAHWDNQHPSLLGGTWPPAGSPDNPPPTLTPTPSPTPTPTLTPMPTGTASPLFPAATATPTPTMSPIYTFVDALTFGPDNHTIITVSSDGIVRIWELAPATAQP